MATIQQKKLILGLIKKDDDLQGEWIDMLGKNPEEKKGEKQNRKEARKVAVALIKALEDAYPPDKTDIVSELMGSTQMPLT